MYWEIIFHLCHSFHKIMRGHFHTPSISSKMLLAYNTCEVVTHISGNQFHGQPHFILNTICTQIFHTETLSTNTSIVQTSQTCPREDVPTSGHHQGRCRGRIYQKGRFAVNKAECLCCCTFNRSLHDRLCYKHPVNIQQPCNDSKCNGFSSSVLDTIHKQRMFLQSFIDFITNNKSIGNVTSL